MILRRIREHVEHHNWFAVGIDLAIVIIGVFLGTQATNWNQARLDRERGRESRAMPYGVQSAIRLRCGDRITKLPDGAQVATLPERCNASLSEREIAAAVRKLEAADLAEDLTRHIADIDQKLAGYDRFVRQARDLRMYLQSTG